jgi:hypothetical protein
MSVFLSLDFIYMPSKDVDKDLRYYLEVIGAQEGFNINDDGAHVAMVNVGTGPRLLLADHDGPDSPIIIYRVANLKHAKSELSKRGWKKDAEMEIPHGPICTFTATNGQRFGIYELVRPEADDFLKER